jgi:hypothetical protein
VKLAATFHGCNVCSAINDGQVHCIGHLWQIGGKEAGMQPGHALGELFQGEKEGILTNFENSHVKAETKDCPHHTRGKGHTNHPLVFYASWLS